MKAKTDLIKLVGLIGFFLLLLCPIQLLNAEIDKNWPEDGKRSFPFSIQQEGDMIYFNSRQEVTDLQIEIADILGHILSDEYIALPAQTSYPIFIGDLSEGEQYSLTISQGDKPLIVYVIYK